MKVYSLYHRGTYIASFPARQDAVYYGKERGGDPWDYDIIEEYLSKSPYNMFVGSPHIPISPTKFVHNSQPNDKKPHFETYGGVKADA
jgi:hypothetical protein